MFRVSSIMPGNKRIVQRVVRLPPLPDTGFSFFHKCFQQTVHNKSSRFPGSAFIFTTDIGFTASGDELKGNQVKIPDYPRSCKLRSTCLYPRHCFINGKALNKEASQKTCRYRRKSNKAFGGKAGTERPSFIRLHFRHYTILPQPNPKNILSCNKTMKFY